MKREKNKMNNQLSNNVMRKENKAFFENLENTMNTYGFLRNNPVTARIQETEDKLEKKEYAARIVNEYSALVAHIVPYLAHAQYRLMEFPEIVKELDKNIGEERGSKTHGFTHQDLLIRGLKAEKKIELCSFSWKKSTNRFTFQIAVAICNQSDSFVAGVIYALEDSATPELGIIVTQLLAAIPSDGTGKSEISLDEFVSMHTEDFEPGHRDGFADAVVGYLENGTLNSEEFTEGFMFVMDLMETWWNELAIL